MPRTTRGLPNRPPDDPGKAWSAIRDEINGATPRTLARSSAVTFAVTGEQTLFSQLIPGGLLGQDRILKSEAWGTYPDPGVAATTLTFRWKLGATTIRTLILTPSDGVVSTPGVWRFRLRIMADGSQSAQYNWVEETYGHVVGGVATVVKGDGLVAASAVDVSVDKLFSLTSQYSAARTNTLKHATLELE